MASQSKNGTNMVRWITVDGEYAGQRIDNFLMTQLKGVPRSRIYSMMRKGEVRVNKGRVKANYRLLAGDSVRVPPVRTSQKSEQAVPIPLIEQLEASILYEDDRLLIVNKPSGVAVHGGSGLSHGVIEAFRASETKRHYLELVHRIDRETSGCLMLAKRRSALRSLHEQLRDSMVKKRYLALVVGQWPENHRRITYPLRKNSLKSGERVVTVDKEGKEAISLFEIVKRYTKATLMQVDVITGRTHQIRVHAAHHGFPLAGDAKYGDTATNAEFKNLGLKRLFLHASELEFSHPQSGERIVLNAPLPESLQCLIDTLET